MNFRERWHADSYDKKQFGFAVFFCFLAGLLLGRLYPSFFARACAPGWTLLFCSCLIIVSLLSAALYGKVLIPLVTILLGGATGECSAGITALMQSSEAFPTRQIVFLAVAVPVYFIIAERGLSISGALIQVIRIHGRGDYGRACAFSAGLTALAVGFLILLQY